MLYHADNWQPDRFFFLILCTPLCDHDGDVSDKQKRIAEKRKSAG